MYQVYVLVNQAGKRYIGLSGDVAKRLADHNAGVSKWTAKYAPWMLLWTSRVISLGEARRLESLMKRQKGGVGLDRLMEEFGSGS